MTISFVIPGEPVAQGRPRFRVIPRKDGGKPMVMAYDPKKSKDFKKKVATLAKVRMGGRRMLEGPLEMTILAYFSCPASDHRKRKPALERKHTKKPDIGNVAKGIEDALEGIVYKNDSQIYQSSSCKHIAAQGVDPYIVVQIAEQPE